jgi:vacuolar-type H+-ATPase subunit E/Vma4
METKKRGLLLIQLRTIDEFSYGFPLLEEVKATEKNMAFYDVDNYSESFVLQMAEKFLDALDESLLIILEKEESLEINGVARLLANLAKSAKKPNKTIYLGKNESVLRFSHWLSMQQVANENDLKHELANWVIEP